MDLSKVSMDAPMPSTPASDTIFNETDDSTQLERDPKNDGVVLAQPIVEKPITPMILFTELKLLTTPQLKMSRILLKTVGTF